MAYNYGGGGGYFGGFQPSGIDIDQTINMNRLGNADAIAAQNRQTNLNAGQQLANGDTDAAAATAAQGGNLDVWAAITKHAQNLKDEDLNKNLRQNQALGNFALSVDPSSPDAVNQWTQGVNGLMASGVPVPPWAKDISGRNAVLGLANMGTQAVNAEMARRKQDDKPGLMSVAPGTTLYNPGTNQPVFTAPKTDAAGTSDVDLRLGSDLHGKEYLSYLQTASPSLSAYVSDVISGRESLPNISRANAALAKQVQDAVRQADPSFNSNRYNYQKAWTDPNKTVGKTNIAFNTAIGHLGDLSDLVENAPDSNFGKLGTVPEKWYMGMANSPWLADWNANAKLLADEIAKVGAGGTGSAQGDREEVLQSLNPSAGKDALNAAVGKYFKVMESKAKSNVNDWKRNMGPFAERPEVLYDENLATRDKLLGKYGKASAGYLPASQDTISSKDGNLNLTPVPPSVLDKANAAIKAGANRNDVMKRLQENGIGGVE